MNKEIMRKYKSDETLQNIKRLLKSALEAYGQKDFKKLKNYEVDSLINRQILASCNYERMGIEEVIDKIQCSMPKEISVKTIDGRTIIDATLKVSLKRYIINKNNNEVIDGTKDYIGDYFYSVILVENNDLDKKIICENCGSNIEQNEEKCPYCKAVNPNKNNKFLIVDIVEKNHIDMMKAYYKKKEKEKIEEAKTELEKLLLEERRSRRSLF